VQDDSRVWRRTDVGQRYANWLELWEGRVIAFAARVFVVGFGVRGFGVREGFGRRGRECPEGVVGCRVQGLS